MAPPRTPLLERLWERVAGPWEQGVGVDDCWLFRGRYRSTYGYGLLRSGGRASKAVLAHREIARQFWGAIPDGHVVRHLCDLPLCCNPFHLRPGTPAENVADRLRARTRRKFKRRARRRDLWRDPTPEDYA